MIKEKKFLQIYDDKQINKSPLPDYIYLKLREQKGFKIPPAGTRISKFEELLPGIISPVSGEIKEMLKIPIDGIESDVLKIAPVEDAESDTGVSDIKKKDKSTDLIFSQLKRSGYFLEDEISSGCDIIVSAADADPLCSISQQILKENQSILKKKFEFFKKFFKRENIHFVVAQHQFELVWKLQTAGVAIIKIPSYYPSALPEILIDSLKRKYSLNSPLYISIEDFLNICSIAETGVPILDKVVTVSDIKGSRNLRVKIGTPVKFMLAESDLKNGSKVISGGPMRGSALYDLETPVTWNINCICVQYENHIVRAINNQCLNCGRCNDNCPVSLSVNMITRYSEFSDFDKCSELGVENCIECGICSYSCPAGRSLVQLIRLAKSELKESKGEKEQ
ncbi:MAG: 4Fe-4S dicluster domain-containing protein [Acidobacteriota bacterium]